MGILGSIFFFPYFRTEDYTSKNHADTDLNNDTYIPPVVNLYVSYGILSQGTTNYSHSCSRNYYSGSS